MKKVGIVVVTYNRLALLKEAIDSLRNQIYTNREIVVVNNGSTDGTQEWLNAQKDIIVITQQNQGGAGGFFTGMKYVAEHDYDYCWVMDDDVVCHSDALQELVNAYTKKPNIGFVCSKVIGINGCPMNTPTVDDRPTSNGDADFTDLIAESMIKVKTATFVSVLCSVKTIKEVGLPYKEFFIWGDDTEYTNRISLNHECYMACRSVVVHKRAIQGPLSFETETDPSRRKMYFYEMRNEAFIEFKYNKLYLNRRMRFRYYVRRYWLSFLLLMRGNFAHAALIIKSTNASWFFSPIVQYPYNAEESHIESTIKEKNH